MIIEVIIKNKINFGLLLVTNFFELDLLMYVISFVHKKSCDFLKVPESYVNLNKKNYYI